MVSTARKTAYPDATTLIALATEMASSVKGIIDGFVHFVAAPRHKQISNLVRRVGGTARILSLRAVVLVADETAELAARVESERVPNTPEVQDALQGALAALHRYLTVAASAKVSSGVLLHPAYVDVMACMPDRRALARNELFVPVSPVFVANAPTYDEGKFIAEVGRYQQEFHQELGRYEASRSIDTVNAMRTALVTMETKNPPADYRTLFGLAITFFDIALRNNGKIAAADEPLLHRLDQQLAGVVRGEMSIDEGTVSWFLRTMAHAPQFSKRIASFQETYELQRLAEDDEAGTVSEQTLLNAQRALENCQKTWEAAMQAKGDIQSAKDIQAAKSSAFAFMALCNTIGDYSLRTMAMAICSLADGVSTSSVPLNQDTAVFGASILLAVSERLSRISQDPRGGRDVADFHRNRVQALLRGETPASAMVQPATTGAYNQAILTEVINNVSAAEQIIDQCLREGAKDIKVKEALKLFGMVRSALMLLNLQDGAELAHVVESHVRSQMEGLLAGGPVDEHASLRMAEGVTLMGRYLQLVSIDVEQAKTTLAKARNVFATEEPQLAHEAQAPQAPAPELADASVVFDVCEDEELGPIFYDEAREVIGNTVLPGLAQMRKNLVDEQALVDVRRGFHTLKGSARMVGLNNLGMLGQFAEYSLNVCRDNKAVKPTLDMVNWLEGLCTVFSQAIVQLEAGQKAPVDVASAEAVHKRFMDDGVFTLDAAASQTTVQAPVLETPAVAVEVPLPETQPSVTVGEAEEPELVPVDAKAPDLVLQDLVEEAVAAPQQDKPPVLELDFARDDTPASLQAEADPAALHALAAAGEGLQLVRDVEDLADMPPLPASSGTEQPPEILATGETNETGDVGATAEIPAAPGVNEAVEPAAVDAMPESSPEVHVGDVVIPGILYNAFVTEARAYYNELDLVIRETIAGKRQTMEYETMRLAHSLAGMGRTTGLFAITELASEIEAWASVMRDHKVSVTEEQATTLRDTLEALEAMVIGVEDQLEPVGDPDVVARMKQLVSDAEHALAHGRTQPDVSASDLSLMEEGGEVSDNGVSVVVHAEEVVLDSVTADPSLEAGPLTLTVAQPVDSFPTTVPLAREHDTDMPALVESVHIVADSIQGEGAAASFLGQDVVLDDAGDDDLQEVPPTIVESVLSQDEEDLETQQSQSSEVFVAPDLGGESQAVQESNSVIPPTIQTDIGTSSRAAAVTVADGAASVEHADADSADWLAMVRAKEDDIDPDMLEIFLDEAQGSFESIDAALSALAENPGDRPKFQSLKRSMHTLKGSSNTAGARKIGALFHHLEDVMTAMPAMTASMVGLVQAGVDAAFAGIEALRHGRSVDAAVEKASRNAAGAANAAVAAETHQEIAASRQADTSSVVVASDPIAASQPSRASDPTEGTKRGATRANTDDQDVATLRVASTTVERMVKTVGEVGISRSRVAANIDLSKISMHGLAESLAKMDEHLRAIELEAEKQMVAGQDTGAKSDKFDALQMDRFTRLQELTRRVAEAKNDLLTQQAAVMSAVREMEEAVATQHILLSDLSSDLDEIRQIRVSSMVPALKRVVRAACRDTGKLGEIFFDADVEVDRGILDKIAGPIEHILRNAIAHGIEAPADRVAAGKPEGGTIEFRAIQDGGEVVIEIRDDGRGIDSRRVLAKAVERGLVKPGTRMTEDKVHELLFEPGFSTAEKVSDIAGRGVGLDVVRSEVSAIGGRVDVQSVFGGGTTFVMRLPATLTVISGTAVTTNGHMYVIPVSFMDRLVRISARDLDNAYKSQKLIVKDATGDTIEYDFWGLWQLVGAASMETRPASRNSILLLRGSRTAVHVDDIRTASEFVFRPMGPQMVANSGLIGSTINAAGNACLVIDPNRIVRSLKMAAAVAGKAINDVRSPMKKAARTPLVLIVDDSLTVRKVTTRLLKREGLRHMEAENGMQALERLQEERPDVILMDIEMPVMNGYEATQAIRATPETSGIPIIMITSRVGDAHRQRALDLGVNEYLGKPYNDADLLELINKHANIEAATA